MTRRASAVAYGDPDRATSAIVGVAVLLATTVVLAGVVSAMALSVTPRTPAPQVGFTLAVDADDDRIAITHTGGDQLLVTDLRVRVHVDGVPLAHQPPVPFFVARGFRAGPTGPFNVAADRVWTAGETAGFRIASTNDPGLVSGGRVRVRIYAGDQPVADLTAPA